MGTLTQSEFEIFVGVSTGHFDPLIQQCETLAAQYRFFGQIGSGDFTPSFPFVRVLPLKTLKEIMGRAEVVVTHAGTGMLSLCYEMGKRTVVIPKQRRYGEANDGQVQLGRRWCEIGLGIFCPDVKDLAGAIERARSFERAVVPFPPLGQKILSLL